MPTLITALVSRKGGVGKTTTTVNLAAALAAMGKRVLVVDLDSQASASLSLGVHRDQLAPSIADVLLNGMPVEEVIRPTGSSGLELITASVDLVRADQELDSFRGREGRLQKALEPVAGAYDLIFLDCPAALSLLPANALVAADQFLVPAVPQFLALSGLSNTLEACQRIAWDAGRRVSALGILLTMVDYRTRSTRRNVDAVRAELGAQVFAVEIRINVRLAEAPAAGQTIFQFDAASTGAHAYRLLAEEFLLRSGKRPQEGRHGGLPLPEGPL